MNEMRKLMEDIKKINQRYDDGDNIGQSYELGGGVELIKFPTEITIRKGHGENIFFSMNEWQDFINSVTEQDLREESILNEVVGQTIYVVQGVVVLETEDILGLYDSLETAKFALGLWYDNNENHYYDLFTITPIKINDKIKDYHPNGIQIAKDMIKK